MVSASLSACIYTYEMFLSNLSLVCCDLFRSYETRNQSQKVDYAIKIASGIICDLISSICCLVYDRADDWVTVKLNSAILVFCWE